VALLSARRIGPWLAAGPLRNGIRLRADDRVFRIGNAAAEAHPIIGEGMSMAFQSAWLLCTHLIGKARPPSVKDWKWQRSVGSAYVNDWHQQFDHRIKLASAFAHIAMRPSLAALMINVVRVWPGLLPLGASWGGKTRFITTTGSTP
jgi:2-polyprenyl-6-methoxyphenol hydroxylase-like FAD-dependent oxidoreductase